MSYSPYQDEQDGDGGLTRIGQLRSSDPIYRKISTTTNQEVSKIHQSSKFGQEIISEAWSPDGAVFAFAVGTSTVSVHSVKELLPKLSSVATAGSQFANWPQSLGVPGPNIDQHNGKVADLDQGHAVTALTFGSRASRNVRRASEVKYNRFIAKGDLLLAVGLASGEIKIWDMATGKVALLLQDHTDAITSLAFTPDGSFVLVSASKDCTVKLWDLMEDGNMFRSLAPKEVIKPIKQVAWSPDAQRFATVGDGKIVLVWEMDNYTIEHSLQGHQNDVTGCRFSADGQLLYTSSFDTRVICWNVQTGQIVRKYEHMSPPPTNIFAAGTNDHEVTGLDLKQTRLATICNDGNVRIWDVSQDNDKPIACVSIMPDALTLSLTPNEEAIALGCEGGFLQFYTVQ